MWRSVTMIQRRHRKRKGQRIDAARCIQRAWLRRRVVKAMNRERELFMKMSEQQMAAHDRSFVLEQARFPASLT
jgi:hypothetical protein